MKFIFRVTVRALESGMLFPFFAIDLKILLENFLSSKTMTLNTRPTASISREFGVDVSYIVSFLFVVYSERRVNGTGDRVGYHPKEDPSEVCKSHSFFEAHIGNERDYSPP